MNLKSYALSIAAIATLAVVVNTITSPSLALAEGGGGGYSQDGDDKGREGPSDHEGKNRGDDKGDKSHDRDKNRDNDGHNQGENKGNGHGKPKGDGHGPKPHDPGPKPEPQPEPEKPQPQQPNFPKSDNDREVAAPSVCVGHAADHKAIVPGVEADLIRYYDQAIAQDKWVTVWVMDDVVVGAVFKGESPRGKKWKMTQRPEAGHVCVKRQFR